MKRNRKRKLKRQKGSNEESITAFDKSFRNATKGVFLYLLTICSYKSTSTSLSKSLRDFQLTSTGITFQLDGNEGKVRY